MNMSMDQLTANSVAASRMLKAIANQSRLKIVCQLVEKEMSVGDLLATVPLSQSALSQHLSVLRRENIVSTRREAQSVIYALSSGAARTILETLNGIYRAPDSK